MEPNVRRYIYRILLLHVAFLAAVAAVIVSAGIALYASARADAESAALERVAVPLNQTKDLLERHFQGIFDTMRLADRTAEPSTAPPQSLLSAPTSGQELWSQLQERVSALLEVKAADLSLIDFRANPQGGASGLAPRASEPGAQDGTDAPRIPQPLQSTLRTREQAEHLIQSARDWLVQAAQTGQPAVSGVVWVHGPSSGPQPLQTPVVLAVLPLPASGRGANQTPRTPTPGTRPATQTLLVGIVPVGYLEESFLFPASQPERNGMLLFDSNARLVAGGGETLAGSSAAELAPKHLPRSLADFIGSTVAGATSDIRRDFNGRVELGGITMNSALATARAVRAGDRPGARDRPADDAGESPAAPDPEAQDALEATVDVLTADQQAPNSSQSVRRAQAPMWLIALVNREAVVAPLEQTTRTAVLWAGAMVIAVTAILVSSAIQLIRGRSHLERLRTEMLDRELREARQIQLMWLPDDAIRQTPTRQVEIAAENVPASHISGDFYNYFDLADGRTAVVIGDVTGHGMTAAFLMATTQLLVKTTLQRLGDPGKTLEEVNNNLCTQAFHGQFVTIQLVVINTRTREMKAASAGHPPPLTCTADGTWRALDIEPQLVLGVLEGSEYPTQTIQLEGCETLLLYTDGIIELKNGSGDRFSLEQLLERMRGRFGAEVDSAKELVEQTFQIVRDFAGDTPPDDDLTLLAVHLSPRKAPAEPPPPGSSNKQVKQPVTLTAASDPP